MKVEILLFELWNTYNKTLSGKLGVNLELKVRKWEKERKKEGYKRFYLENIVVSSF